MESLLSLIDDVATRQARLSLPPQFRPLKSFCYCDSKRIVLVTLICDVMAGGECRPGGLVPP